MVDFFNNIDDRSVPLQILYGEQPAMGTSPEKNEIKHIQC